MGALSERLARRGMHFWLFEDREVPGGFVEFAEGPGPGAPRGTSGDPREDALEAHLASLARYGHPRHVTCDAVALPAPDRS
jgi:hypothetical protein